MTVELRIEGLGKTFAKSRDTLPAVRNVDLLVPAGELVTLLGPSGCGKTTILRMVAGFETPTEGKILVDGGDITGRPVHERGIGFVFQNYALFPHMSIFENIAYGLRSRQTPETDVRRRVGEALELVGLRNVERRYPNQLSGGEQQRVALARVLVLEPNLLLMDEPLSNLDAKLRLHMRTEIRRIQQHLGITCLYVTHDQKEALTLSDRVMVLNRGQVEQIGSPFELYSHPRTLFVADFIGQANVLPARVESVAGESANVTLCGRPFTFRCVADSGASEPGPASVVLRPENVTLTRPEAGRLPGTVRHRFFVGDHMEYEVELPGAGGKVVSANVPYAPGMELFETGAGVDLDFADNAPVVLFQI